MDSRLQKMNSSLKNQDREKCFQEAKAKFLEVKSLRTASASLCCLDELHTMADLGILVGGTCKKLLIQES